VSIIDDSRNSNSCKYNLIPKGEDNNYNNGATKDMPTLVGKLVIGLDTEVRGEEFVI
jgi:hypothetical protein